MLTCTEFATKPFIQRACATPFHPESVLSFFFGANYLDNEHVEPMREGVPLKTLMGLWYQQSDDYDRLCCSFSGVVKAVGKGDFRDDNLWSGSIDGKMSQVILCDQLARNCFRGTDEAFAHGDMAEELTLSLVSEYKAKDEASRTVPGEFYPPYMAFLLTCLMHSEEVKHHELALEIVDDVKVTWDDKELHSVFDQQGGFVLDHKAVLDQFGRYPHRNSKLGRSNTPEEQAWLDDKDNLPGWAKSQG